MIRERLLTVRTAFLRPSGCRTLFDRLTAIDASIWRSMRTIGSIPCRPSTDHGLPRRHADDPVTVQLTDHQTVRPPNPSGATVLRPSEVTMRMSFW